jgi:hypothetical protein
VDQPGGVFFAPRSTHGRFDNPDLYESFYLARDKQGAIIERCGEFTVPWHADQLLVRISAFPDPLHLALAEYEIDTELVDFYAIRELAALSVSTVLDVIARDRARTQGLARQAFQHQSDRAGLTWWSFYDPELANVMLWKKDTFRLIGNPMQLTITSPIITETARRFFRQIEH